MRLCIVVAAALAGVAIAAESEAPPDPKAKYRDALRLIDIWVEAQRAYERVPGLSVGVVIGQELAWSRGYGAIDVGGRIPATPSSIYSVCSISKLFTSVAVMQLVESGRLRLDDELGARLPAFAIRKKDEDSLPITIRYVLSHASGLPRESDFPYWTSPDFPFPTSDEMFSKLGQQSTMMPAADHYQYSNLGMALLGSVVEQVSGMPYAEYVQRHILDPLKLVDTRTHLPVELLGTRLATGFGSIKRDGTRDVVRPFDTRGFAPAAGFTSTVEDLARFASWQFRLLKGGKAEVLRPSTLREMHRVHWTNPDGKITWGLGFGVARDGSTTVVSHAGSCPGYRSALALVPKDGLAFIVLSNAMIDPASYSRPMRQLLAKAKAPKPVSAGKPRPDLEAYAGYYQSQPWGSESVIVPWGDRLAILGLPNRDPAGNLDLFEHIAGDTFRAVRDDETLAEEVVFVRGPEGNVIRRERFGQRSDRLAPLR
jgi:CubicO group peptidase (beta-lactamase class C family)